MISVSPSSYKRKARDLNPHDPKVARFSRPARRAVSGYLPYSFHRVESRELNPDFRHAIAVSSRWTMTPLVERRGIEPRLPGCKPSVFPLDQRPVVLKRSVRELNPVFRLTTAACCRNTYRPVVKSDPGWNRTSTLLHVTQASSPLDHGIVFSVTRVGVEPTKSPRPQRDRFACLRTWSFRKWRVRGLSELPVADATPLIPGISNCDVCDVR